jgi:hypothetical protein
MACRASDRKQVQAGCERTRAAHGGAARPIAADILPE